MESKYLSDKYLDKYLLFIYLLINSLYVFKYAPSYPIAGIIVYCVIIILSYTLYRRYSGFRQMKYLNYALIGLLFVIASFLLLSFDPYSTTVSRWSALYFWSEKLFSGEYPYLAATHVSADSAASPFPIWQIIHIPFYFLGEIGVSHICIILLLIFALHKFRNQFDTTIFLGLLCLAPSFWWEITVRSDLMNNMFVCILFISIFHFRFRQTRSFLLMGFFIGLLLCTRLFTGIPLAIYFIPWLLQKEKPAGIKAAAGALLGFIIPFTPLAIWNRNLLFYSDTSPIILQTRQGNIFTVFAGLLFVIIFSLLWKTYKQYVSYITCILFMFISLSFSQFVFTRGFVNTIYNDIFDISYFGIAIPFILFGLSYYNNYEKTDLRDQ